MTTYNMTCTCGETMSLEAGSRDEAVSMFKAGMDQAAIDAHLSAHHHDDAQKPTLAQVHAMVEQSVAAV